MGMWVGRGRKARVAYGFDDIALVPGALTVNSSEVDISWELCGHRYDLPILGVVRPGAVTAALTTRNRRVGVIATPATVRSHAYFAAIKDENPAVEVYEHATPAFVPLVEAGLLSGRGDPTAQRAFRSGRVQRSPPASSRISPSTAMRTGRAAQGWTCRCSSSRATSTVMQWAR